MLQWCIVGCSVAITVELIGMASATEQNNEITYAYMIDERRWGLSTLQQVFDAKLDSSTRRLGSKIIKVMALTLEQFFNTVNIIRQLSYNSINTEKSEVEIIGGFPFDKLEFVFISVEHNHHLQRSDAILSMVGNAGYKVLEPWLNGGDVWFIKNPN